MRFSPLFVCLLVSLVTLPAIAADWLNQDVAYSGTRTMRMNDQVISGPIYYDHGKERFEWAMEGERQVSLRRPDSQRFFMIMMDRGMGMEMKIDDPRAMMDMTVVGALAPEEMGRETRAGESVTKYQVVQEQVTFLFWVTDDGIPLHIEGIQGGERVEVTLSDLKRGPQPAELFEPPADIQIIPMPDQ